MNRFICLAALITGVLPCAIAEGLPDPICDNFDRSNGDLSMWEETDLSGNSSYSLTDGVFEINVPPGTSGPGVTATYADHPFTDFVLEADLLPDPDSGRVPVMAGLYARATDDPGTGTSYAASIGNSGNSIEIWDISGASGNKLVQKNGLKIPWEKSLRMVFSGIGEELTLQLFDGTELVGETSTMNSRYQSGDMGIVQFHLHHHPNGVRTRFDNFKAYHPDKPPATSRIVSVDPVIDGFTWKIKQLPGGGFQVDWTGGGTLQRLDAVTGEMVDVAAIPPFVTVDRESVFRVRDPWNGRRATDVYVPDSYDEDEPTPLLIALHGRTPDTGYLADYLKLQEVADSHGFLLAHPEAIIPDSGGWFAFEDTGDHSDSAFLIGLIEAAKAKWNVDPNRVFLYGHSAGGRVAFQMIERYSSHIAAIASLEGMPRLPYDAVAAGAEPVHVLHLHGTAENESPVDVPFSGGPVQLPTGVVTVAGVEYVLNQWAAIAGHDTFVRDPDKTLDLQDNLPGLDTTVSRMTGGDADIDVVYWEIENSKHFEPGHHDDFSEDVIDWLLAHPQRR